MSATPIDLSHLLGNGPIAPVIEKYRLGDEPSEIERWRRFSGDERLAALIDLRKQYLRWRYGTESRFERLLTVTRQA